MHTFAEFWLFVVVVRSVQQDTPLFIMVSISPCLPHPSHTTGRDSLESKVTFIQLSECASSVECTGDKDLQQWKQPREQPENHIHIKLCSGTGSYPRGSCVSATGKMRHEPKYVDKSFSFFLFLCYWLDRRFISSSLYIYIYIYWYADIDIDMLFFFFFNQMNRTTPSMCVQHEY